MDPRNINPLQPSAPMLEVPVEKTLLLDDSLKQIETVQAKVHQCGPECILRFPLHHAARRGNFLQLKSFLEMESYCGSYSPLELDCNLRTPLHYAAGAANCDKGLMCVQVLLSCSQIKESTKSDQPDEADVLRLKKFVNIRDKNGETALHIAAKNEATKIVKTLLQNKAKINMLCNEGINTQLCLIYTHTPDALCLLMKQSVSFACNCNCEKGDDFLDTLMNWQKYYNDQCKTSFSYVCMNFAPVIGFMAQNGQLLSHPETLFLFEVNNKKRATGQRKSVLSNTVARSFLYLKWQKLKWFCYSAIFFHLLWLSLYIGVAIDVFAINCPYGVPLQNKPAQILETRNCEMTTAAQTSMIILTVFSVLITIKEMSQFHRLGVLYFTFENLGQLTLLSLIFLTVPQVLFESAVTPINYQISAFGIFLAWALMLGQVSKIPRIDKRLKIFSKRIIIRFPNHGVYINILGRVFKNVMVFIIIFSPLLIGFGFSFRILLPEQQEFLSPIPNMMKLIVMMTGELEYDQVFHNEEKETILVFEIASHILYLVFIVVATMILFNLLIGFTVSDIQGLQKDGTINQISNKLEQMYLMESFLLSNKMQSFFKLVHKITGRSLGLESAISIIKKPKTDIFNPSNTCHHVLLDYLPDDTRTQIRYLASHNTFAMMDTFSDKLLLALRETSNNSNTNPSILINKAREETITALNNSSLMDTYKQSLQFNAGTLF